MFLRRNIENYALIIPVTPPYLENWYNDRKEPDLCTCLSQHTLYFILNSKDKKNTWSSLFIYIDIKHHIALSMNQAVQQSNSTCDSRARGPEFDTRSGHIHVLMFPVPYLQTGHLSVSGESMSPVLRRDNQQNFKIVKILILLKSFISLFYIIM